MPADDARPSLWRLALRWVDPLVVMILSALLLGLLLPARGVVAEVLDVARTAAIVLLFFLYGARMATGEVWAGLRSWRLQGSMLAATYVAFPVLGLLVQLLPDAVVSPELKTGPAVPVAAAVDRAGVRGVHVRRARATSPGRSRGPRSRTSSASC